MPVDPIFRVTFPRLTGVVWPNFIVVYFTTNLSYDNALSPVIMKRLVSVIKIVECESIYQ